MTLLNFPPIPITTGSLTLFTGAAHRDTMHHLVAWLAGQGPVNVQDCSCSFDAVRLMTLLRLQTSSVDLAMERVQAARAFTCYQFKTLLAQTPATSVPTVIFDVLHLLYDDNIALPEAMRLFHILSRHLTRLQRVAPIIASAGPPPESLGERAGLWKRLSQQADMIISPEPASLPAQLKLLA